MNIEFPCWSCGKQLKAKAVHAGRKCKCTNCDNINSIPGTKIHDPALDDAEHDEEEETQDDDDVIKEQVTQPTPMDVTPFQFVDTPLAVRLNSRKGPNWLIVTGALLLALGIFMLVYYLLIFDPTVPEFPINIPNQRRFYNNGLMNHKIVGCIASGILSLVGTILVVAGSFKKQITGSHGA